MHTSPRRHARGPPMRCQSQAPLCLSIVGDQLAWWMWLLQTFPWPLSQRQREMNSLLEPQPFPPSPGWRIKLIWLGKAMTNPTGGKSANLKPHPRSWLSINYVAHSRLWHYYYDWYLDLSTCCKMLILTKTEVQMKRTTAVYLSFSTNPQTSQSFLICQEGLTQ